MNSETPSSRSISIIVPALNEEHNLERLLLRIEQALIPFDITYEVVVIDDNSTDRTYDLANQLATSYPVRVFKKQGERGKAFSLLEGFNNARYDLIAILDADLQYPPEAIREMLEKVEDGADVVVANRVTEETSFIRKLASRTFAFAFARLLHGLNCDVQSGLKLFRKKILTEITLNPTPWTFDMEFLLSAKHCGYNLDTVDIDFAAREHGESKIKFLRSTYEIGTNALKLKFRNFKPVHISPSVDGTMIGAGIAHKGNRFVTHTTLPHHESAIQTFMWSQRIFLFILALVVFVGFARYPLLTGVVLMAVVTTVYFLDTVFSFFLLGRSLEKKPELDIPLSRLQTLDDSTLPVYSILCPLYKEANVIPQFLAAIDRLDWPHHKLDVILLLEENDPETIQAARTMVMPSYVRIAVVPHSLPKTKPKACNFGLSYARGQYLVIYDAEDVPDPLQLKKAYCGFQDAGSQVACLQGKLNYYNPRQNLLTRLFTAEYSLWFDLVLPSLQSINTYIPLGGTSNHFKISVLRELAGWDPFNVTEDCDLGIRLFRHGYTTAIIDSVTLEEANSNVGNWLRQRSRWIKGYMQTYLVHMRKPIAFTRENGFHALIFQLTVGCKIAFTLINPLLWLATILYFTMKGVVGPTIEALFPAPVLFMGAVSMVFGNFMFFYYYMVACARREQWGLIKFVFFIPLYWLATSIASYRALYQLFLKPHYWEKTHHGLYTGTAHVQPQTVEQSPENQVPTPLIPLAPVILTELESNSGSVSVDALFTVPLPVPIPEVPAVPEPAIYTNSLEALVSVQDEAFPVRTEIPARRPFSELFQKLFSRDSKGFMRSGGVLIMAITAANFLNLIFNAFLGRVLNFADLGLLSFMSTVWYVASVFINALSSTVTHKTAVSYGQKNKHSGFRFADAILERSIIASLILSLAWVIAAPALGRFFKVADIGAFLLYTPIFAFGVTLAVHRGFLNGILRFRLVASLLIVESVSKILIALGLYAAGVPSFVYLAIPASILLTAVFAANFVRTKRPTETVLEEVPVQDFPGRFYVASLLTNLATVLFLSVDMILVKHYLSPDLAGQYAMLSIVGKMVYFFGILPNSFTIPLVSRDFGLKQSSRKTLQILLISTTALVSLATVGLGLFGWLVVPAVLGSKASVIVPHLTMYVAALALFTISTVLVSFHLAKRQYVFPIASLCLSALLAVGIVYYHDSLASIVHVMFSVGALSVVVMGTLHAVEKRYPFIVSNALDFLDIFSSSYAPKATVTGAYRILIFNWRGTQHAYAGGAEVYVHEIARGWVSKGHSVTLFCGNDGMSSRTETIDGVQIVRRGGFYLVYFWAFIYCVLKFRGKFDIIIDGHNGIPFFTPLYSRRPIYCLMHHVHQEVFRHSLSKPLALFALFLERRLMPLVYRKIPFVTVSDSSKAEMQALGIGRAGIDIVQPGVDLTVLRPGQKSEHPLILYLGRLKAYKSIEVLLAAFARVVTHEPSAQLVIAGSGEHEKQLRSYADELGITSQIRFAGKVDEKLKLSLLQQAWVLVNPSLMEGWGITTIEANACATPVIASNVPGLRDSVISLQTGYLAPYGDVGEFAEKILNIIQDGSMRHSMMQKAVIWANSFDWRSKSEKFFSIITPQQPAERTSGGLTLQSVFILALVSSLLLVGLGYGITFGRNAVDQGAGQQQIQIDYTQSITQPNPTSTPDWLAVKKLNPDQAEQLRKESSTLEKVSVRSNSEVQQAQQTYD